MVFNKILVKIYIYLLYPGFYFQILILPLLKKIEQNLNINFAFIKKIEQNFFHLEYR